MEINILIIFFIRKDTLQEVFDRVKKAKPSKLFLFCDGARNENDKKHIEECRHIVEDIDWPCEVHKYYSEENLGCGAGPKTAISWAFNHVDNLVILEDDCVPADSFFPFMKECLEKYKDDTRIGLISGFNHLQKHSCGENSYFFTKTGATLGWGTWKRVWEKFDFYLEDVKNSYLMNIIKANILNKTAAKKRIKHWLLANIETKTKKVNYWDIQFGFLKYSQNYLAIVPKTNLITNIGAGFGATHTADAKRTKWKKGKILFMPTIELRPPLKHPSFVCCDNFYDAETYKILYKKSIFKRIFNKIGRLIKHG